MQTESIPGYSFGTQAVARSPITQAEFELMKQATLFGEDDVKALQMSYDAVSRYADDILDTWYGFIGSLPQLVESFSSPPGGKPSQHYLDAVRQRFRAWILDTASANYDQKWLDYQHEIGLRHRDKKGRTDQVDTTPVVPFRYLFPLIHPVTATLKPFLAKSGRPEADVERMHAAWVKTCLLQLTLWSRAYVEPNSF